MATFNDLTVQEKRDYFGWMVKRLRRGTQSFDTDLAMFKRAKGTITDAERQKMRVKAETDLDTTYADLTVDNFRANPGGGAP